MQVFAKGLFEFSVIAWDLLAKDKLTDCSRNILIKLTKELPR